MTTLMNIASTLRGNWALILGLGVLVGITMLNAGCDDAWWGVPNNGWSTPGYSYWYY
ncbi:MAG: hypothetical protein ABII12_17015 [Planctomycetota bacterium]